MKYKYPYSCAEVWEGGAGLALLLLRRELFLMPLTVGMKVRYIYKSNVETIEMVLVCSSKSEPFCLSFLKWKFWGRWIFLVTIIKNFPQKFHQARAQNYYRPFYFYKSCNCCFRSLYNDEIFCGKLVILLNAKCQKHIKKPPTFRSRRVRHCPSYTALN